MRSGLVLLAFVSPAFLSGCAECAGTPSCHNFAEISEGGQFIEHKSGSPVAGVAVAFVRRSGIAIDRDTVKALSDAEGFFTLRVGSVYDGSVYGDVLVIPPAPYQPYTISDVTLRTSRVRGNGGYFGRWVVNPYLVLVGHVRDRKTHTPLPDVTVTMRRIGGGRLAEDSRTFVTDAGGQFAWVDPEIVQPGTIDATFEIQASGYPRSYNVPREVFLQHQDGQLSFIILPVGSGLSYSATTGRRGSGAQLPGVTVEFRRTGGIATQPEQLSIPVDANGSFPIPIEPLSDGTVFGELTITPPAPYPAEVHQLTLETSDDDRVQWLGVLGYGAQVYLRADLRDANTGESLPEGTVAALKWIAGVPLVLPTVPANGDPRALDSLGRLVYQAPTPDSGMVQFEVIVQLPAPLAWDTIPAVNVPARYSDAPWDLGTLRVRRRPRP